MKKVALIITVLVLAGLLAVGCGPAANTTADKGAESENKAKMTAEKKSEEETHGSETKSDEHDMEGSEEKSGSEEHLKADADKPEMEEPEGVPDTFKIKFECSNGTFVVKCVKRYSPLGVEHLYELVKSGFYDDVRFFRVVPDFVVQFGMSGDPDVHKKWSRAPIKDEGVIYSNKRGTISYAKSGPNTRTTQLFVNLNDNPRLDSMGFPPLGTVISGMDVVEGINSEYRERPNQDRIKREGNKYLKKQFPNLDYIIKATIIE